jgi:hypothetical protein
MLALADQEDGWVSHCLHNCGPTTVTRSRPATSRRKALSPDLVVVTAANPPCQDSGWPRYKACWRVSVLQRPLDSRWWKNSLGTQLMCQLKAQCLSVCQVRRWAAHDCCEHWQMRFRAANALPLPWWPRGSATPVPRAKLLVHIAHEQPAYTSQTSSSSHSHPAVRCQNAVSKSGLAGSQAGQQSCTFPLWAVATAACATMQGCVRVRSRTKSDI